MIPALAVCSFTASSELHRVPFSISETDRKGFAALIIMGSQPRRGLCGDAATFARPADEHVHCAPRLWHKSCISQLTKANKKR